MARPEYPPLAPPESFPPASPASELAGLLPVLLAVATLLLIGAAIGLNHHVSDRLLRHDATARAQTWADELRRHHPSLAEALRDPDAAGRLAGIAALAPGPEVVRFRLLDAEGRVVAAGGLPPNGLAPDGPGANGLRGNAAAGAPEGPSRRRAPPIVQASAPIADAAGHAGMLEAELDQSVRRASYRRAFLLAEGAIVLLGGGIIVVLGWLALRRRREDAAEARALFLQRHDALTGLCTHAEFRARLDAALSMARRQDWRVGVLVLDLRRFRAVNEAHGRAAGDAMLGVIAARLRANVRAEDPVARLSADRFAVVETAMRDAAAAAPLAERLMATIAAPITLPDGRVLAVEANIGLVVAPDDGAEAEVLLSRAEAALSAARAQPDAAIRCFEPELDQAIRRQRETERDLRAAIAAGALTLHYQPQRRLRDGALVGFEALLRWPHPERGMIPPIEFIPLAEQNGLIVPLGAWALRAACTEAARWPGDIRIAVNLSPAQFKQGQSSGDPTSRDPFSRVGLVDTVRDALAVSGLPASRLELEVTESLLQTDPVETEALLRELRALGVSIAMDDFGTGWSSLAHLWRFPFGKLKIDRAFVAELGQDPRLQPIVATVVALGRTLGMTVIAEGVETADQARLLAAEGCEQAQGWLFGRPMPADAALRLIEEEARNGSRMVA